MMPDPRTPEHVRQQIKRIRTVRWVLVSVSAALAIALIVHGDVLIGALVAVIAGVRAWMLVTMPRRMDAMRQQRRDTLSRGPS
jgi:uncharacterized membrane protein